MVYSRPEVVRGQETACDGLLVIDKPTGCSSHDVVNAVRRLAATKKVGHAGTLDPNASGVILVGIGRATKLLTYLVGAKKTYQATIRLGISTSTEDADGEIVERRGYCISGRKSDSFEILTEAKLSKRVKEGIDLSKTPTSSRDAFAQRIFRSGHRSSSTNLGSDLSLETDQVCEIDLVPVQEAISQLTGKIWQRPSAVSAIKVSGQRAYQLVRSGHTVDLPAREVEVYEFLLLSAKTGEADQTNILDIDVIATVSSGTYIRALARDLGEILGCGAHLQSLRRVQVGQFVISQSETIEKLSEQVAKTGRLESISLAKACKRIFPGVGLTKVQAKDLSFGRFVSLDDFQLASLAAQRKDVSAEDCAAHTNNLVVAVFSPGGSEPDICGKEITAIKAEVGLSDNLDRDCWDSKYKYLDKSYEKETAVALAKVHGSLLKPVVGFQSPQIFL